MRRGRMKGAGFVLLVVLALVASIIPAIAQDEITGPDGLSVDSAKSFTDGTYVVIFDGAPVVAYDGDIKGLPATKPKPGQKVNPNSAKVIKYQDHLIARHDKALANVGVGQSKKLYSYTMVLDGAAADLQAAQAEALAASDGVLAVVPEAIHQLDTISTADFLGLTAENGAWDQGHVGEDVIVGIIDSGIWPEHPSVSDRTGENKKGKSGKLDYQQIPGWHGKCTPGEDFPASLCNHKLIAAQWFGEGFGGEAGVKAAMPYEIWSARDVDGHGTHTATTAAGNGGVVAEVEGIDLGTATGMAPRARIAAYKACWGFGGDPAAGCSSVDTTAAIDQAVADGVDVINYSISGTQTNFLDPVEISFLFAADAGVFVAASAGNSGPGASTVAHPSPWITTVAAGTHDRYYEGSVVLGDGTTLFGASFQEVGAGPATLVHGGDIPAAGADPADAALCAAESLDDAAAAGNIVMCDRGAFARVAKSAEVARAGGIGMVHGNVSPSSINADLHSVPTVHLQNDDADIVRAYIAAEGAGATAEITKGVFTPDASAPAPAAFSSRGPLLASTDLLKPDIMAPGVDVIAGVSPIGNSGRLFDAYSGTSMSSPHIAGLAAMVMSAHPDWSPAAVKSALMTTSDDTAASPFAEGTGHVVPTAALDPGLVYEASFNDYLGFMCGTGQLQASYCSAIGIDPSDLNQPNITVGELAGSQTVTRTVTNVGPAGTYGVAIDAPAGVDVVVDPASLSLGKGESASYDVTFTVTESASTGSYAFGNLTWSDGSHDVRSTLTVRPVQAAVPGEVFGSGTEGSLSFDVAFGYSGDYSAAPHGLVAADLQPDTVTDDPSNDINAALDTCDFGSFPFQCEGITWHAVPMAPGSVLGRIQLFDDYTDGADDLDLYVWDSGFGFVGGSGSPTSAELVEFFFPTDLIYLVAVHGWQTDGPDAEYTLFSWGVPAAPGSSNMSIDAAPVSATLGSIEPIDISWAGLDAGTKYLGAVSHSDAGGIFDVTLVSVDTD